MERAKEAGRIWRGQSFSCDNPDSMCALFSRPSPCPLVSVDRADRRSYSEGRDNKIAQFVRFVGGAVLFVQDNATLVISPAKISANL